MRVVSSIWRSSSAIRPSKWRRSSTRLTAPAEHRLELGPNDDLVDRPSGQRRAGLGLAAGLEQGQHGRAAGRGRELADEIEPRAVLQPVADDRGGEALGLGAARLDGRADREQLVAELVERVA